MAEDLAVLARRMCLQNAVQHGGTCQPKGLVGRILGSHAEFRKDPAAVLAALEAAGAEVNAMGLEAQKEALAAEAPDLLEQKPKEKRTGLKPLPKAEKGKVVLRFAPNPNGPLSLGHSRGVAILAEYAREYQGQIVLRFDDTDAQVKPPLYDPQNGVDAYAMVADDFAWLAGRAPDRVVKASDRLDVYYDHARLLLEAGGAYVCTCDAEAWREMKEQGHPCPHRDLAAKDMLPVWQDMVDAKMDAGSAVLRVKTDIQHKDPALRDWTAFRIIKDDAVHPRERAGEIERRVCWPLLDFESAVEDHEQGVTHIIRGKDLMDSTRKQTFLYKHLGWEYPQTLYWGRVSVHEFGKFSTSGMRKGIEAGTYTGWDDVRLPTLQALRRRGFRPDALRAFWISLGLTEKDIAVSMENIEAENGKRLDAEAPRYFFVPDPRGVSLSGAEGKVARPLLHPPDEERGRRELTAGSTVHIPGDEAKHPRLRLKDLGNIVLAGGTAFWSGDEMDRSLPIVQWLPHGLGKPFTVLRPDGEELHQVAGLIEPAALKHVGTTVQFERFGFVTIEDEAHGVYLHP